MHSIGKHKMGWPMASVMASILPKVKHPNVPGQMGTLLRRLTVICVFCFASVWGFQYNLIPAQMSDPINTGKIFAGTR